MRPLFRKEWRLAIHPTNLIFLSFSALLLIPNYPYYVTFFYTGLGLFFLCLNGRENHDIEFSLMLPVPKRAIVEARVLFAVCIELMQLLLAVPFALLRQRMLPAENSVGMDANIALFGLSLLQMGIFNAVFFTRYFRAPAKIGKAFVWASSAVFAYIIVVESLTFVLPLSRDQLDTPDPQYATAKLITLGIGLLLFALLNWFTVRTATKRFEALDF